MLCVLCDCVTTMATCVTTMATRPALDQATPATDDSQNNINHNTNLVVIKKTEGVNPTTVRSTNGDAAPCPMKEKHVWKKKGTQTYSTMSRAPTRATPGERSLLVVLGRKAARPGVGLDGRHGSQRAQRDGLGIHTPARQ